MCRYTGFFLLAFSAWRLGKGRAALVAVGAAVFYFLFEAVIFPMSLEAEFGSRSEDRPAVSGSTEYDPDRPLPTPPKIHLDGSYAGPTLDPLWLAAGAGAVVLLGGAVVARRIWRDADTEEAPPPGRSAP